MRFLFRIQVLDTGLGLRFGMGFRFGFSLGIRVWDTGLGFRFYIQMGVSWLRFRLGINV